MAETLSPNPSLMQKQRAPILSPGSPFFLGSNDDKLERAQARAARAAAVRRKPVPSDTAPFSDDFLGKEQIMELFQNCIKLASENVGNAFRSDFCADFYVWWINSFWVCVGLQKINQKNTWELGLIDHLCDIIKVEEENDVETNFQKVN